MSLPGSRVQMSWFFQAVSPAARFLENNIPTETTFRNLVSSVAFHLNPEDTADSAQTQQGLLAQALAVDIAAATAMKDIGIGGNVALAVNPAQLPIVALTGKTVTPVQNGAGALVYTLPEYLIANQDDVTLTSLTAGQILSYNGSKWVNGGIYYQTVKANLSAQTQRPNLNFSTVFSVTDDSTPAHSCTTIDVATGGITYAKIQVTVGGNVLIGNSTGAGGVVSEQTVSARLSLTGGVLDIASHGVTYAYMQNATQGAVLIGNAAGAAGALGEITIGTGLSISGGVLNLTPGGIAYSNLANTVGSLVMLGNFSGAPAAVGEIGVVGLAALNSTSGYQLQSKVLKTVSASTYTVLLSDFKTGQTIGITYTATGAVTVTLPNPATVPPGVELKIVDTGGAAGTHNITINPFNTETINGASSLVINTNYGKANVFCDGTNWYSV